MCFFFVENRERRNMENINSQFAFETHQMMDKTSINLSFAGEFSSDLVTMLLLMAKSNIRGRSVMKKIYKIMIEGLDNLTKHSLKSKGNSFPAMFILAHDDNFYYLATGNKIKNKEISPLKDKLTKANELSKVELRNWYNEILINDDIVNHKGGAGLGIIDMALKSGNKFGFDFNKIDDNHSFFTLKIKVGESI